MFNTNKDKWKDKYYQAIDDLDKQQKRWSELESSLRKGIGRLAIVAQGDNEHINSALKDIRKLARKEDRALQSAFDRLEVVIKKSEKKALEENLNPSLYSADIREIENMIRELAIGDVLKQQLLDRLDVQNAPVREILKDLTAKVNSVLEIDPGLEVSLPHYLEQALLNVMSNLVVPPALLDDFRQLVRRLENGVETAQWSKVLEGFSDLASRSIAAISAEKQELEAFLRQITSQITEMESFVLVAQRNVESSRASTHQIRDDVDQEVTGLEQDVNEAADIEQVKGVLSHHIEKIREQMKTFVTVEEERLREAETNNQNLTKKLTLLDKETTALRDQLEKKHKQLLIDPLTRISNRFAWEERYKLEFERWKRNRNNLCLAVWDIDKFKSINDNYGHKAGDRVLKLIAKVINSRVRKTDFFARIGGEEFVMLLPDTTVESSLDVLNVLREYVEACPFNFHGKALTVTISCGVTAASEEDDMESLFERADKALYSAKEKGRNRCVSL